MATVVEDIQERILQLSPEDRGKILSFLIELLDGGEREEGWEEAWREELEHRRKLVDEGKMEMIPLDEAKRRLREQFG